MRVSLLTLVVLAGLCLPAGAAQADGGPIMPLSQVQPGMNCTGETVIQGTTISSFNVQVIDVVDAPGEGPRILVQVSGPAVDTTGVAEGFSGSPVYCPNSFGTLENAGAISEGIGQYGNNVVLVTPIEQMLGEPVEPPTDLPRLAVKPTPLLAPLTVGGLSPAVFGLVERAGESAGRMILAAPTGGSQVTNFPVQPLVPGASVSASYSSGDVPMGAVGTVTYVDGPTVYAFGHELDGAGRRSLLLQDAYVYYVVNNPDPSTQPSYKLASPGHTEGTLSSDTPNAVIGEVGAPPPTVPVDVTVHDLDTGRSLSLHTDVADETDVGLPLGNSILDTISPLEVAQAATQIYDGPPASESGSMCLRIYLRESREPLGFCNRYVGTGAAGDEGETPPELAEAASADVTSAFQDLEQVNFAALHVTHVVATLNASRGLAMASILSARAPLEVKAGSTVKVRLDVRIYRGARRTITFRLRIPAGASGPIVMAIHGPAAPAPASSSGLSSQLVISLSPGGGPSGSSAITSISSLADLRAAVATIPTYDGLYANELGHAKRRAFQDPSLLIIGRTTLPFVVQKRS
ncbi:MAG TPA: hypothetical protein VMA96_11705 [Solirubrobacteraceae bacterium]|nr:hypothetical protein [Solirubrobacteraceae bacterium]